MINFFFVLFGWYIADLVTGIYHYFVDNYGSAKTPIFGKQIKEFQEHHIRPRAFLYHSQWDSLKLPLIASIPFLFLAVFNPYFFLPLAIGIAFSQWIHKWSHMDSPPAIIKALQKCWIVLPKEEHQRHHTTFDNAYCIVNGWSNPLLDRLINR